MLLYLRQIVVWLTDIMLHPNFHFACSAGETVAQIKLTCG